jgi:prepilin-type N-terminal cleavage/methylation domain-containing protein
VSQLVKDKAGLTLIELLIAITIIALIAAAFVPLFVLSAKSNVRL